MSNKPETKAYVTVKEYNFATKELKGVVQASQFKWDFIVNWDFEIKDPNIENTETIDAQPGDVGIWTGNTLHSSEGNGSDFQRSIWLQVYSSIPLGKGWRSGYYDKQFLRNGEIAL